MPRLLFDFADPLAVEAWSAIDDRVMGGLSMSRLRHVPNTYAIFEGVVSLERNGGFVSVRSSPGDLGLAGAATYLIEVRGAHRRFKLRLSTDDGFDRLNYQSSFETKGIEWQAIRLPLTTFRATFRGREVADAPALDPSRIRQVGLMIADGQAGPFALDIRRIGLD